MKNTIFPKIVDNIYNSQNDLKTINSRLQNLDL